MAPPLDFGSPRDLRQVEGTAGSHQPAAFGRRLLPIRSHHDLGDVAPGIEAGGSDEFLEAGVFHLHVGEHVLAEQRVLGLLHLEPGNHLGVRHNQAQESRIGRREGARLGRPEPALRTDGVALS